MKPVENILDLGIQMLLSVKYLSCELLRFLTARDFSCWRISNDDPTDEFPLSILVYGRETIANDVVAAFFNNKGFIKARLSLCTPSRASEVLSSFKEKRDSLIIRERPFWKKENRANEMLFQTLLDTRIAIKDREFSEIVKQEIGHSTRRKILHSEKLFRNQARQTRDLDEILDFRQNLLVPFAEAIHGEQAGVPTANDLIKSAGKLRLILIEKEGRIEAGLLVILSKRHNNLTLWYLGMEAHILNDSKLKAKFHICLFGLALRMACDLKLDYLSDSVTYPIMNNGNLNYKLRLGCKPVPLPCYPSCSLTFLEGRESEVLFRHPLIGIKGNELYGMMGITQLLSPDNLENYFKAFFKQSVVSSLSAVKCFVRKNFCNEACLDRLGNMELDSYAFQDADVEKEHTILTFRRTR